jgi:hypothetical protein
MKKRIIFLMIIMIIPAGTIINSCRTSFISRQNTITDTIYTIPQGGDYNMEFHFEKGREHNYPLMAIWITDTGNNYIQTLYISESVARGIFKHGETSTGKWLPGPIRRPAALPVWSHSRGVREDDGLYVPTVHTPITDAYTGATPLNDFVIYSDISDTFQNVFNVFFEINQSWDWNDYWTNNKYPEDEDYKTSCQPSLVYCVKVDMRTNQTTYNLDLVGHGHYSGDDGEIYADLSTFTTALEITKKAFVIIRHSGK